MKICTSCKQLLSLDKFGKCHVVKDGLTSRCKECKNAILRQYRKDNPELVKEQKIKYYKKDRSSPERLLKTIWNGMVSRCRKDSNYQFSRYGGRGINIGWDNYHQFRNDMLLSFEQALKNGKNSIDRINNDKGYSKDNCRFADAIEQANNTRRNVCYEYKGKTMTLAQICRLENVTYKNVWKRINNYGWSLEKSLY